MKTFSRREPRVVWRPLCVCFTALAWGADPALTIYNQNFAVIRETLPLDLKAGNNTLRFSGATAHVEPDSVILRDPAGRQTVQVLEQNYRNDPVSQERLLNLYEGKTIEFAVRNHGRQHQHRQRQDRAQRVCAALPGDEPVRCAISGQPDGDGVAAGRGAAHHRGGRKAAVLAARAADLSHIGRRHDSQTGVRLDPVFSASPPGSTPS